MQRLLAGLVIALGCHALLLIVPIQHHQASRSRLPESSGITVGFSRIEPLAPRNEVRSIPPSPEPILPLKERIEKLEPTPKPKRKLPPTPRKPKKEHIPIVSHQPPPVKTILQQSPKPKPSPPRPKNPPAETMLPDHAPLSSHLSPMRPSDTGKKTKQSPSAKNLDPRIVAKSSPPLQVSQAYPENDGNPPPKYPVLARRRGWEGTVLLSVWVLKNGRVGDITIEKSSGYPILDKTALTAVSRYRFVPGRHGDQPVAMRVQVPVHFRLQDAR